jgi:hypothetical protein
MNPALNALHDIRNKHYLDPDTFREMLHTDPNVLHEEERMYLTRLALLEADIISDVEAWVTKYQHMPISDEDWKTCALLLTELNGPLSMPASEQLVQCIREAFPSACAQFLPPPFRTEIYTASALMLWWPRIFLIIATLLFVIAWIMPLHMLYAPAAIVGAIGAIGLFLKG